MKKQIELRLPAPEAKELVAVFLDPMTKSFAEKLCGNQYDEAKREVKDLHRLLYDKLYCKADKPSESADAMDEELPEDTFDGVDADGGYESDDLGLTFKCDYKANKEEVCGKLSLIIMSVLSLSLHPIAIFRKK